MSIERFDIMRKRVLREHRHSIVRSALRGHKSKGRGLVLVKFSRNEKSGTVHLSFLTLETLKGLQTGADPRARGYEAGIIEKVSGYHPDSQIAVMVTDGESKQFSFGVKRTSW